jgi:hypothetical protein
VLVEASDFSGSRMDEGEGIGSLGGGAGPQVDRAQVGWGTRLGGVGVLAGLLADLVEEVEEELSLQGLRQLRPGRQRTKLENLGFGLWRGKVRGRVGTDGV